MAFLSRGHLPGPGKYGEQLNRAIDFVLSCPMSNGRFLLLSPGPVHEDKQPSHNAVHNHEIDDNVPGRTQGSWLDLADGFIHFSNANGLSI